MGTIGAIRSDLGWNGSGMDAILPVNVLPEGLPESDELCQGHPEIVDRPSISTVHDVWSRELCEGTCESLHPSVKSMILDADRHGIWSLGRFARAITLRRTTTGACQEFNAQLEAALYGNMKGWCILLLQYLIQQNMSNTAADKVATGAGECKQYCVMPLLLLTNLAVKMLDRSMD